MIFLLLLAVALIAIAVLFKMIDLICDLVQRARRRYPE